MGSITFQVTGDASVGTKTKTFAVADADINRLAAWAIAAYTDAGQPPPTQAQALLRWAQYLMEITKQLVINRENQAAQSAVQAPAPIVAT